MERLYLSGPMSGYEDFNYDVFNYVAARLRYRGFDVANPAENFAGDSSHPREDYMRLDVQHVLRSDAVVLLPDWETSRGARVEVGVAYEIGLRFYTWGSTMSLDVMPRDKVERKLWPELFVTDQSLVMVQDEILLDESAPETVLDVASRLTSADRQSDYGHPIDDFGKTIGMWNALFKRKLREPLDERDFCSAMICVKLSRLEATPDHHDSNVDVAGYTRTREMIQEVLDSRA